MKSRGAAEGSIEFSSVSPSATTKMEFPEFESLRQLIDANKVTTIEQLIPLLPKSLRDNFTLVHKSQSRMQDASPMNPRAILFGDKGHLMLTFNGEASQLGFNAIEAMAFDPQKRRFELREIEFKNGQAPKWSQANPAKCTSCHGQDPRPIWASYNIWSGVYGENDDRLQLKAQIDDVDEKTEMTTEDFKKFRSAVFPEKHPRYSWLGFDKKNECFPYHCKGRQEKSFKDSPNTRLTLLNVLNHSISLARRIENSATYPLFKYSLAYAGTCPIGVDKSFQLFSQIYEYAAIPAEEIWLKDRQSWGKEIFEQRAPYALFGIPYGITAIELQFHHRLLPYEKDRGFSTFTGLKNNGYDAGTAEFTAMQILRGLEKKDPDLQDLIQKAQVRSVVNSGWQAILKAPKEFADYFEAQSLFTERDSIDELCESLLESSEQELTTQALPNTLPEEPPKSSTAMAQEILVKAKCMTCHQGPLFPAAPPIPFQTKDRFREYVNFQSSIGLDPWKKIQEQVSAKKPQMPPSGPRLTPEESDILMKYLRGLAQ